MMTKRSTSLLIATTLVACARNTENIGSAESALDSQEGVEAEGNVMMAAIDGADVQQLIAPTADQVASRIAANVQARYSPAGCAMATATGANVSVQLTGCTGPRGLRQVSGQLELAVSVALSGVISVHGTASGLEVNGATIDVDADATYSTSGANHVLAVRTQGSGIGPRGNDVDHVGEYTITWDSASMCRSIAGEWSTEISTTQGSARRRHSVDLQRCAGGCPSGSLVRTFFDGATLTVTFDGTATAQWTTSAGRSGRVPLQCQ